MTERLSFLKGSYFNVYRQNITSSYILLGQEITGCNDISLLLLYNCMRAPQVMLFQGKLAWPFPSRLISRFLKEGDTFVFLSASWVCISLTIKQPYSIPLLSLRSFLQQCATVLDVCAVMIRVGKMLSVLWSSFVCLLKWSCVASYLFLWKSETQLITP